jgi:hypothetical protein
VGAVHDKEAFFFCQLWHVGRASHPGEAGELQREPPEALDTRRTGLLGVFLLPPQQIPASSVYADFGLCACLWPVPVQTTSLMELPVSSSAIPITDGNQVFSLKEGKVRIGFPWIA